MAKFDLKNSLFLAPVAKIASLGGRITQTMHPIMSGLHIHAHWNPN